jgi:hypothetical protein
MNPDDDLHTNGDNPFAQGSPRVDDSRSSAYPFGAVAPYYSVPQPGSAGGVNPNAPASGDYSQLEDAANQYTRGGLGDLYDHTLGNLASEGERSDTQPHASEVYRDQGYGDDGRGRS